MKKTAIASAIALSMGMGVGVANAAAMSSGTFHMWSPYGFQVNPAGNDTTIAGNIGGGTWSVSSTKKFFGAVWTAHGGTTFGPGTYTFNTVEGPSYTNVVVGAGQVGGHILFDWNGSYNIDVINVWNVSGNSYTSSTVSSSAANCLSKPGSAMIDGPFGGNCANFDFRVVPVPAAVWLFGSGLVGLVGIARRRKAA
jgi:hypothetical protein